MDAKESAVLTQMIYECFEEFKVKEAKQFNNNNMFSLTARVVTEIKKRQDTLKTPLGEIKSFLINKTFDLGKFLGEVNIKDIEQYYDVSFNIIELDYSQEEYNLANKEVYSKDIFLRDLTSVMNGSGKNVSLDNLSGIYDKIDNIVFRKKTQRNLSEHYLKVNNSFVKVPLGVILDEIVHNPNLEYGISLKGTGHIFKVDYLKAVRSYGMINRDSVCMCCGQKFSKRTLQCPKDSVLTDLNKDMHDKDYFAGHWLDIDRNAHLTEENVEGYYSRLFICMERYINSIKDLIPILKLIDRQPIYKSDCSEKNPQHSQQVRKLRETIKRDLCIRMYNKLYTNNSINKEKSLKNFVKGLVSDLVAVYCFKLPCPEVVHLESLNNIVEEYKYSFKGEINPNVFYCLDEILALLNVDTDKRNLKKMKEAQQEVYLYCGV